MKTLTQVVLPIAAVIGLVFGVTFISNYTKTVDKTVLKSVEGPPLRFQYLTASPEIEALKYWRAEYEVGEKGHFDYWFTNTHPQEVTLSIDRTNCQCTGADLGLVPKEAWYDYLQASAIQSFPGLRGAAVLGIADVVNLNSKIRFQPMKKDEEKPRFQVPAVDSHYGPAIGIVRMYWVPASGDPSRNLEATLFSQLPNSTAVSTKLAAHFAVIPPLHIYAPQTQSPDVRLGTLSRSQSVTSADFICWSATRSELNLSIGEEDLGTAAPCVQWSKPVALSEAQRLELARQLSPKGPAITVRSAYRVVVTAYERRTIEHDGMKTEHQLDLGPLEFRLKVTNQNDATPVKVPVSALVRGDIRLSGNNVNHFRIALGDSFNADEDYVARISVFSDRPGVDLELLDAETRPDYLKVQFAPQGETDGRKEWELKVTVPAKSLIGTLPLDSYVLLRIKDGSHRKIKIPIRGTGVGSGLPRI